MLKRIKAAMPFSASNNREFYLLGIESSCDETAAAVVSSNKRILSNVIYSQIPEHRQFNGVVPEIAARSHLEKIDLVTRKAIADASIKISDLSAVAGTCGPGLIGGVIVGATFAKGISLAMNIPFIAVNHIEAHALTARLTEDKGIAFPYLLLLASGGHCQICVARSSDDFEVIGRTLDDSAGEAFDKISKMLNLGYPGGPIIEKFALNGNERRFKFPHPMCDKNSLDFSFSGLKTSVRILIEKNFSHCAAHDEEKADICASFQHTIAEIFMHKVNLALEYCRNRKIPLTAAVIAGGVAANKYICNKLKTLCDKQRMHFICPPPVLCTDNGAMIAWAGIEKFHKQRFSSLNFQPKPRWPLGEAADCSTY